MSTETATSSSTKENKTKYMWLNIVGLLVMHVLAVYGLWLVYASARFATVIWVIPDVSNCIFNDNMQQRTQPALSIKNSEAAVLVLLARESTTIGAHRLFSHRSFKATWPIRLLIVVLQTMAGENCLYIWVRDHRQHHKYRDTDADPHNARRGLLSPYIGWLMVQKHPEVIAKRKTIDMSDLEVDSLVMFQKRYYTSLYVVLAVILPIGVPMIFWNEDLLNSVMVAFFLRHVALINISSLHNSADHRDLVSTESSAALLASFGEGRGTYHYAFPWDYRTAEHGQNFNISTAVINFMAKLGMVYDLRVESLNKTRVIKNGDESSPVCNETYNEKPQVYTEESVAKTVVQNIEYDSPEWKETAMKHSLSQQKIDEPFENSPNNPITTSQTQQKSAMEDAVIQKIFSDLGFDEDVANERNFVSSSLLKGNTAPNNKQRIVSTTRTENVRQG